MKTVAILLWFLVLFCSGICFAQGVVVIYNTESEDGFVYSLGTGQSGSTLLVLYPSQNRVRSYSERGLETYFIDDMVKFLAGYSNNIAIATRSFIKPYYKPK